jgi:AraC-like DNA-binding protein
MILSLGLLGIFLSALLIFYNKGYRSANIYLGLFLFFFNFIILSHSIYLNNQSKEVISFVLSIPINATVYAIGPLALLYVRSILNDNAKFSSYDWLHFIIFAIFFVGRLLFNLSGWDNEFKVADDILNQSSWKDLSYKNINQFIPIRINYVLKSVHLSLYLIAIWVMLLKENFNKSALDNGKYHTNIVKKWLYFFTIIITLLVVFLVIIGYLIFTMEDKNSFQKQGNILFSLIFIGLLVLIIGLILFPQILYGIPMEKLVLEELGNVKNEYNKDRILESHSYSEDYMKKIRLLLENWSKLNKFLDIDSSVYGLSKDINLPVHHITYFFNHINNEKYIDWRNRMRIEYAIGIINNQEETDKTLETLGKVCGFRSYSAFMQNFKQYTGKLPYEYIKEIKQKRISNNETKEQDLER